MANPLRVYPPMRSCEETVRGAAQLLQLRRHAFDHRGSRFDRAVDAGDADPIAVARQPHAAATDRAAAIAEAHQPVLADRPLAFVPTGRLRQAEDAAVGRVVLDII